MKIVVFGGTTEGREAAGALAGIGASVTVCVATAYGAEEQGVIPDVRIHCGRLDEEQMAGLIRGVDLVVDATHPYAIVVTQTIHDACRRMQVPYRRILREAGRLDTSAVCVEDAAAAARWLAQTKQGQILLTTGAKELHCYAGIDPARLVPRVLPMAESLAACEAMKIPHRNIIAMQGPFSRAMNEALIRERRIRYLVTKNSGRAGGFAEKMQACAACGVTPVVLMRRPEPVREEERCSIQQLLAACRQAMKR